MNTRNQLQKKQGFTLIELLVVIVIIMVIAAMMFVAAGRLRQTVKRRATYLLVKQIESACNQYYVEYNKWPTYTASGANTNNIVDANFTQMLQGNDIAICGGNPRRIVFLEVDSSRAITNGALIVPINPGINNPVNYFQFHFADGTYGSVNKGSYDWLQRPDKIGGIIATQRTGVIVWAVNPYGSSGDPNNTSSQYIGSWQ